MPTAWGGADPTQAADPDSYELGIRYTTDVDITLTHARIWTGPGEISLPNRRARVWTTGGGQQGIATLPDDLAPGWTQHAYDTPIEIFAGATFIASYSAGGNYGALADALIGPVVSNDGHVTAPAGLTAPNGNGVFNVDPNVFPAQASGNQTFYGSDVVYELGHGGNTPPVINSLAVSQVGAQITVQVNASDAETLVGASYKFNWGDGSAETTVAYPTISASHTYTLTGTYAILVTVTDANGLSDTAATPVDIVVLGGRELTYYDIPKILLDDVEAALASTIGGPVNRACLVPSTIAWDECECGAIYVSVAKWFLSETFPVNAQGADTRTTPCELPWLVGEIVIQVMRCAPTPQGRTSVAPTCAQLDSAAKIYAVDAYVTMKTALSTLCGLKEDDLIIDFSFGEQTGSGPEGMCVGSELRVFIAVPR